MLQYPDSQHFNTSVTGRSSSSVALSFYWVKHSYPQNSVWCIVWGRYLEQASAKNQYLLSPEEWQSSVNMPTRAGLDSNLTPVFHIKRTYWCQWRVFWEHAQMHGWWLNPAFLMCVHIRNQHFEDPVELLVLVNRSFISEMLKRQFLTPT